MSIVYKVVTSRVVHCMLNNGLCACWQPSGSNQNKERGKDKEGRRFRERAKKAKLSALNKGCGPVKGCPAQGQWFQQILVMVKAAKRM